jgi:UDP-3-O-[3-hydroxymyristoyl] glucosamine N-acyltransferase
MTSVQTGLTAEEIALRLGGELQGDPARVVSGVETVDQAGPDSLTWVGSSGYGSRLAGSKAGVVLMPPEMAAPAHMTVIRVEDPDLALCQVLGFLAPPRDEVKTGVHSTAVIGEGARVDGAAIGPNVVVGEGAEVGTGTVLHAGVFVGRGTKIGEDCILWPNVVVREYLIIGDRVIIHPNATIGADGFSYIQRGGRHIRVPQIGTVVIEDDVEIGANTAVDRARSGATIIGRGAKLDNLVQIAHNCEVGEGCLLAGKSGIAGSTTLGKYVVLGGNAVVIDHVKVGDGVQMGAGALVLSDLPEGAQVRGAPARALTRFGREQVALKKLPDLLKTLRKLEERLAAVERSLQETDQKE